MAEALMTDKAMREKVGRSIYENRNMMRGGEVFLRNFVWANISEFQREEHRQRADLILADPEIKEGLELLRRHRNLTEVYPENPNDRLGGSD